MIRTACFVKNWPSRGFLRVSRARFGGYPHVVKIDHRAGGAREWVAILKRHGTNSHHANGVLSRKGIRTLPQMAGSGAPMGPRCAAGLREAHCTLVGCECACE